MDPPSAPSAPSASSTPPEPEPAGVAPPSVPLESERAAEEVSNTNGKLQNLKFLNAAAFALTALVVMCMVLGRVREEGVFGNEYLWMKYQTLLTPATYVDSIWIVLFLLQGLFIYAATLHPSLQHSPLVGYAAALGADPRRSVAVHYPAVCAGTLLMVVSHDHGLVFMAFLASLLLGYVLRKVVVLQTELLGGPEVLLGRDGDGDSEDWKGRALRYAALRLPFELLGGYVLALAGLYFNIVLHGGIYFLPTAAFVAVADITLVLLTLAGFWILWKTERKFYGMGAALAWYLLGVSVELFSPSQPIYNEFSDAAILATQIVAGVATLVTVTLLAVRVVKTMIKDNLFKCVDALGRNSCGSTCGEDELGGDYVHA